MRVCGAVTDADIMQMLHVAILATLVLLVALLRRR